MAQVKAIPDLLNPIICAKSKYAGNPPNAVMIVVFFSVSYSNGSIPYAIMRSPHQAQERR
jgi:hypothetical protein